MVFRHQKIVPIQIVLSNRLSHLNRYDLYMVDWGRERMDLSGITAIGIDEISWKKGKFMTLVYQINGGVKRLLWASEDRTENSIRQFFSWLGEERTNRFRRPSCPYRQAFPE